MVVLGPLIEVTIIAINLYVWVIIASVIVSWLVAFNVVNVSNRFVFMLRDFLYRATEPAIRPIRRFMPNLGGIDLSPVVLLLLLFFLERMLGRLYVSLSSGGF